MGSVDNILVGAPVQIALYDSTNGVQFLGYLPEDNISVKGKPLNHSTVSGLSRQYGTKTTVQIKLLESDPASLAQLMTRRDYKQTVYITGWNYGLKITNIYLTVVQERNFEIGEYDTLQLTGTTEVESDVSVLRNLLGADGGFEVDTNTDGVADGWAEGSGTTGSRNTPTFLSSGGGSYDQQVAYAAADQWLYHTLTWNFDQPIKLIVSVYARAVSSAEDVLITINTLDSVSSVISSYNGTLTNIPTSGETEVTLEASISESEAVYGIQTLLVKKTNSGTVRFDNCQLELRNQTAYTENT